VNTWAIELSYWILIDGNYPTTKFEVGQVVRFAVEFYLPHYSVCTDPVMLKAVPGRLEYDAVAEVVFRTEDVLVLNMGELSAFREYTQNALKIGDHVQGRLSLHVDPFMYYETLHMIPDMPALIHEWRIDSIEIDTTPLITVVDEDGRQTTMKDESRISYETVNRVDSCYLKGRGIKTIGSWVLHCTKLDRPPSKVI
jgi:hypothetical protein